MGLDKVGAHRLQVLATELRTNTQHEREHFHMNFWFKHLGECPVQWVQDEILAPKILHNCGTVRCALGTAAMIPSFRAAGLKIVGDGFTTCGWVTYKGRKGIEAAEHFFRINYWNACDIFMPKNYGERYNDPDNVKNITPKMVARRIEKILRKHGYPVVKA